MMYLLERIAAAGAALPEADLRELVRQQIDRVVRSHFWPGATGLQLMDMNLPPLAGFGHSASADVERYAAGLGALIARHEPRLKALRVGLVPTGESLAPWQVRVTGLLPGDAVPQSWDFELPQRA